MTKKGFIRVMAFLALLIGGMVLFAFLLDTVRLSEEDKCGETLPPNTKLVGVRMERLGRAIMVTRPMREDESAETYTIIYGKGFDSISSGNRTYIIKEVRGENVY